MESQSSTQSFRGRSKQRRSRSRSASVSVSRFAPRVPRSISLRTNGDYRLTRFTNMYLPYTTNGFQFPAGSTLGVGFVFYPDYVQCVTTASFAQTYTSNVPNYAELAGVWDRVELEKVELIWSNKCADPTGSVSTNISTPVIFIANDQTNVLDSSITVLQQMEGCKTWHSTSTSPDLSWTCKPMYQELIYYSALLSSYKPGRGLIASDASIPHYGVRAAFEGTGVGSGGFYIRFKYTYKFRDVK